MLRESLSSGADRLDDEARRRAERLNVSWSPALGEDCWVRASNSKSQIIAVRPDSRYTVRKRNGVKLILARGQILPAEAATSSQG